MEEGRKDPERGLLEPSSCVPFVSAQALATLPAKSKRKFAPSLRHQEGKHLERRSMQSEQDSSSYKSGIVRIEVFTARLYRCNVYASWNPGEPNWTFCTHVAHPSNALAIAFGKSIIMSQYHQKNSPRVLHGELRP